MPVLKQILVFVLQIFFCTICFAQPERIDSLKKLLPALKDSAKVDCLNALSEAYITDPGQGYDIWYVTVVNPDSAILFAQKAIEQAEISNYRGGRAKAYYNLGGIESYLSADFRKGERYQRKALESIPKILDENFLGRINARLGVSLWYQSEFAEAMESFEKAEQLFQKTGDKKRLTVLYLLMSTAAWQSGYFKKSLQYALKSKEIAGEKEMIRLANLYQMIGDNETALNLFRSDHTTTENFLWIGEIFVSQGQYDSAKYYYRIFEDKLETKDETQRNKVYSHLGELYLALNEYDSALMYLNKALNWHRKVNDGNSIMWELVRLGNTYKMKTNYVKAKETAIELLNKAHETGARQYLPEAHFLLYRIFEDLHQKDSAYLHLQQYIVTKDVIDKDLSAHKLAFYKNKSEREQAQSSIDLLHKEKQVQQAKLEQTLQQRKFVFAGVAALLLIGIIFFRNISLKRKNERHLRENAENELQMQKLEGEKTKAELQKQATELEMQALRAATQEQLIQSEKMASLGELTSGIAHEIKNPLNFINNFSEINMELITEMEAEQMTTPGENDQAQVNTIIKTLKKNSEKINHHGKRIDGIVKGMLHHSRLGNVTKELVDINSLCDESLKLAWHAFKAKEKTFNASFETRFDPDLPPIMAIPQDFGRVMINLINNAFYAVHEKKKHNQSGSADIVQAESLYKPSVIVSTKKNGNKVYITVSDNGMGIPATNINKIFQPFFTTKPTGEGTGLGLSMSYDIITKSHGGEIKAKSKEGLGTDFEMVLPV